MKPVSNVIKCLKYSMSLKRFARNCKCEGKEDKRKLIQGPFIIKSKSRQVCGKMKAQRRNGINREIR